MSSVEPPFKYPVRWPTLRDRLSEAVRGVGERAAQNRLVEEMDFRDRNLEDYLAGLGAGLLAWGRFTSPYWGTTSTCVIPSSDSKSVKWFTFQGSEDHERFFTASTFGAKFLDDGPNQGWVVMVEFRAEWVLPDPLVFANYNSVHNVVAFVLGLEADSGIGYPPPAAAMRRYHWNRWDPPSNDLDNAANTWMMDVDPSAPVPNGTDDGLYSDTISSAGTGVVYPGETVTMAYGHNVWDGVGVQTDYDLAFEPRGCHMTVFVLRVNDGVADPETLFDLDTGVGPWGDAA